MSLKGKANRKYKKYRLLRNYWVSVIPAGLLLIIGVYFYYEITDSKAATVWFETRAASSDVIALPKDDAPHQSKMECWYYNGLLTTETGKKYSFHDATFLVNSVLTQMVNHVSFTDYQTGEHYIDQRSSGGNSVSTVNHFSFASDVWNMSGNNGIDELHASNAGFDFNLRLISTQAPVFHGKGGLLQLGSAGRSYYYSRTRMAISGTVTVNGHSEAVKGIAWFNHQWGDFSIPQLSWDWFSLQLDDNSDIMIYQLRDKSNAPILYTATITRNGKTEILTSNDFSLSKSKKWTSSKTGISYPIEWQIRIPAKHIAITTRSMLENSEFDATLTTYNIYWEGAVQVNGTHSGQGFMELSGYANNKTDHF